MTQIASNLLFVLAALLAVLGLVSGIMENYVVSIVAIVLVGAIGGIRYLLMRRAS